MEGLPAVPGYDVLARLGEGASSTVWRARRQVDGLVVALKVLSPADGDVAAGLREAGLLARVRHPHVVHLYDVLPLPDPGTGRPAAVALATQLAAGGSLAQLLARRRMLSPGELVTVLHPVTSTLADLHRGGLVHGDLSTGNVLFLADGMPVLADLGASRITGQRAADLVGTGEAGGMVAPEVVEGFEPTPESDVYQAGALAWLCLTGAVPGLGYARPPLEEVVAGLPAGLADVVERCLASQPEDRPDAEEAAAALLGVAAPEPVEVAPDADPGRGVTERLRQQAREAAEEDQAARPRRRWGRSAGARAGAHRRGRAASASATVGAPVGQAGVSGAPHSGAAHSGAPQGGAPQAGAPQGGASQGGAPSGRRGHHEKSGRGRGRGGHATVVAVTVLSALVLVAVVTALLSPALSVWTRDHSAAASGPSGLAVGAAVPTTVPDGAVGKAAGDDGVGQAAGTDTDEDETGGQGTPVADPDAAARTTAPGDQEVREIVQRLVDGRGVAWENADRSMLDAVMAPGSPAAESESRQLERVRAEGLRYLDVTFRVEDAAVIEATADRLVVTAAVSRAPLSGRGGDGHELVTSPTRTDAVELVLANVDGEWLLWSWGEPGTR